MPKSSKRKVKRITRAMLSFAPGNRLFSEDHFLEAFAPYGVSRRGFRALCRALKVPIIFVGDTRFIDSFSFALAMKAISRVGQPDFVVPGAVKKPTSHVQDRLDYPSFKRDLTTIIAEILAARHQSTVKADRTAIQKAAHEAAERMALAGLMEMPLSSREQAASLPEHLKELLRASRDSST